SACTWKCCESRPASLLVEKRCALSRGGDGITRRRRHSMRIDISFLPALAAAFILCFGRVGAMVMLLPGIGESNLPARVRLAIALALTAVLLPLHRQAYAVNLNALMPLIVEMIQEVIIGLVLGITARLAMSALQIAGSVAAQQLGLGFVTAVD